MHALDVSRSENERPRGDGAAQENRSPTLDTMSVAIKTADRQSIPSNGAVPLGLREMLEEVDRRLAEERLALIHSLFNFDGADDRELALQRHALNIRGRFAAAEWIDGICSLFGWCFLGLGPVELGIDEDIVDRGASFEWLSHGDDDRGVRLELGDEPALLVTEDCGDSWRAVQIAELCDVLGDWVEARRAGAAA